MGKKKKQEKQEKQTVALSEHKSTDQLLIYANYVVSAFNSVFDTANPPILTIIEESVMVEIPDMAMVHIRYEDGEPFCVLSLFDNSSVLLIAELVACLKDIFGYEMLINEETYIQDPSDETLIWGRQAIDVHNEKVWGRKVQHSVYFADDSAGHS